MQTLLSSHQPQLFETTPPENFLPWEQAAKTRAIANVVVNRPLDRVFDYQIPENFEGEISAGQRVRVPFGRGNRLINGYCVGVEISHEKSLRLKPVHSLVDQAPIVSAELLDLTRWIAEYYVCGWGQVLDGVIPNSVKRRAGTRMVKQFRLVPEHQYRNLDKKLSAKQLAVVGVLKSSAKALRLEELCHLAGCGRGPVDALCEKGLVIVERNRLQDYAPDSVPQVRQDDLALNAEQSAAVTAIKQSLEQQKHHTFLLHGVTGSGKTEVYIQAIREVVSYGKQAIVLVPEISLTPQTIERFRSRFGAVAVLHSHLSDAERYWHWQQIQQGKVQVIVGARSAVFAPTPHLGLIVIDEEHESSFKQDATPRYHAREVARRRAEALKIPLILGSATPTLESWRNANMGGDVLLPLKQRATANSLPPVIVVNTRHDPNRNGGDALGQALQAAMKKSLAEDGQIILFLNLRGFSPTVWCRTCGVSVKCPHCDVTLTWHRDRKASLCHVCAYHTSRPQCPNCTQPAIRYLGNGTQKLEEEIRHKFPGVRVLRMDSDSMQRAGSYEAALETFRSGEVQILLGTQMIAKGLDFPNVTLVGVIDADTSLHQPDLRAGERTFQLLSQVAGRTGRGSQQGRVYVQTTAPDDPSIQFAAEHDYEGFADSELYRREAMFAPPFSQMARVIVRGRDESRVSENAEQMSEFCREAIEETLSEVQLVGSSPAPVAKLKDLYRYHFRFFAPNMDQIHTLWRYVEKKFPQHKDVEFALDIAPMNMR